MSNNEPCNICGGRAQSTPFTVTRAREQRVLRLCSDHVEMVWDVARPKGRREPAQQRASRIHVVTLEEIEQMKQRP